MRTAILVHSSVLALVVGCTQSPGPTTVSPEPAAIEAAFPNGQTQIVRRASEISWKPCPPTLPAGCEMALLEGNPQKEMLFTVRFRTSAEFEMLPHWHPRNERVTILEGKIGVGFGDTVDRNEVTWFGAGDYYVNAKEVHHYVLADGPAVLQITGIGPWKANFLDVE